MVQPVPTQSANSAQHRNQIATALNGLIARQQGVVGSFLTTALAADVALNNTATYFDGPSVAQGNLGTWFVIGNLTLYDSANSASFKVKLWDGTNVIASAGPFSTAAGDQVVVTLSGCITAPAGNLRISAEDASHTTGVMTHNLSGLGKDCMITALRVA